MHLNINLASQKFADVRRFFVLWTSALGAVVVLTFVLVFLTWHNHDKSADLAVKISEQKQELAQWQKLRAEAERISNLPENVDVTEQKNFWNNQLMRRQFSWTQLLNDMQKIMPRRAYVSSVHPEFTPDNRLKLTLVIEAEKKVDAVQLAQKMEGSERFRSVFITDDAPQKDNRPGSAPIYRFGIEAYYTPSAVGRAKAPAKEGL